MPMLDGITATRLLLKARPHLPIVFLTADITEDTRKRCAESGAIATLLKPISKAILLKTLNEVFKNG